MNESFHKILPATFICHSTVNPNPVRLTGNSLFSIQGSLFSLQEPCFHYRDFPAKLCTSLYMIAVNSFWFSVFLIAEVQKLHYP